MTSHINIYVLKVKQTRYTNTLL